jgi:hypothetical protein
METVVVSTISTALIAAFKSWNLISRPPESTYGMYNRLDSSYVFDLHI